MENSTVKIKKPKSRKSKISFDEEVVTKDHAKHLVPEISQTELASAKPTVLSAEPKSKQKPKKKRKAKEPQKANSNDIKIKKRKKTRVEETLENTDKVNEEDPEQAIADSTEPVKPEKESVRARKRKKKVKLLEDKKTKVELELQQKSLNYLSKWKHSKSEWKFEKLRQIWLQQNLLDLEKIPNEFWETVVQYFSSSKGMSRQVVLDQAIKFIDADENAPKEDQLEAYKVKLQRARDIVQYLQ